MRWNKRAGAAVLAVGLPLGSAVEAAGVEAEPPEAFWRGAYGQARVEAWSNGLPVLDFEGDWSRGYERRSGRQRAYQSLQAEAGVEVAPAMGGKRWPLRLGVVTRAEALADLSGEAAQVAFHYQSRTDPAQAGRYDAGHRSLSWRGHGLALGVPRIDLGPVQMSVGLQWLRLDRLRRTASEGMAAYDGSGGYDYAVQVHDDDSRARAPFMAGPASSGSGASLSVGVQWHPAPDWTLRLRMDDAWSRLRWHGVNGDDLRLNSQVVDRTPDGYIDVKPALQGQSVRQTLGTTIPMTVRADVAWLRPEGEWLLRWQRRWGLEQAWVGWRSPGAVKWEAAVEPRAGAWRLGVTWHGLSAHLMADRLDQAGHVRGGSLAWRAPF